MRVAGFRSHFSAQNLESRRLKNQNLDFKELNSSIRLGCDDYCEAILKVSICEAQGQMSQGLADGLWIFSTAKVSVVEMGNVPSLPGFHLQVSRPSSSMSPPYRQTEHDPCDQRIQKKREYNEHEYLDSPVPRYERHCQDFSRPQ
jgi:hypothetical protein